MTNADAAMVVVLLNRGPTAIQVAVQFGHSNEASWVHVSLPERAIQKLRLKKSLVHVPDK